MLVEPLYNPIVKRIFTDEESKEILEFMKEKVYVYHRASESKLLPSLRMFEVSFAVCSVMFVSCCVRLH